MLSRIDQDLNAEQLGWRSGNFSSRLLGCCGLLAEPGRIILKNQTQGQGIKKRTIWRLFIGIM